ncbi:MAG: amphi-Trp domain-containing protein [Halobacteriales archaeon]|nr:amphi-Trp domain-containing protein [Halobacteriales archaeon]
MTEEVLFKSETDQSREEIAEYLRAVADSLEAGKPITLRSGEEEVTLDPPARPTFEVKAEREGPESAMDERSVEFEIEWYVGDEDNGGGGALEIE